MSIKRLLLLKALQRSFKMLFPCTEISDDENIWKECHHQSSSECQPRSTGNWQGGSCCPTSSHCFSGEERWMSARVQPIGSDRIPTNPPSSDPSSCPGNSGLARPLAQFTSLHEVYTKKQAQTWPRLNST